MLLKHFIFLCFLRSFFFFSYNPPWLSLTGTYLSLFLSLQLGFARSVSISCTLISNFYYCSIWDSVLLRYLVFHHLASRWIVNRKVTDYIQINHTLIMFSSEINKSWNQHMHTLVHWLDFDFNFIISNMWRCMISVIGLFVALLNNICNLYYPVDMFTWII